MPKPVDEWLICFLFHAPSISAAKTCVQSFLGGSRGEGGQMNPFWTLRLLKPARWLIHALMVFG